MRVKIPRREIILFCSALLFPFTSLCAQEADQPFIHRLGIEARPQYVFPTNCRTNFMDSGATVSRNVAWTR